LNKGDFTKTTLLVGWLLFTLLAVEIAGKHIKCATRFKNVIFRHTITPCRKTAVVLELRKVIFAKFFTSTAKT